MGTYRVKIPVLVSEEGKAHKERPESLTFTIEARDAIGACEALEEKLRTLLDRGVYVAKTKSGPYLLGGVRIKRE